MSFCSYSNPYPYDGYDDDSICDEHWDSEEDTDDASETEFRSPTRYSSASTNGGSNNNNSIINSHNSELKEQMYQHKLANLHKQLMELSQYAHPEFQKRFKKLDFQCKERLRLNDIYRDYLNECVERDYVLEKKAAQKEHDEKMVDIKDNISADFEDRKKQIENERFSLELTNDSMEIKTTVTRKLRRRPNEPLPVIEKRRKPTTGQLLVYLLDEKEIEHDLKIIQRGKPLTPTMHQNGIVSYANSQQLPIIGDGGSPYVETRIEDNKLLYERRWFCRGQQVYVEGKEMQKFAATITAIGNEVVWVKRTNDSKVRINMSHLLKGKIWIKRRAN